MFLAVSELVDEEGVVRRLGRGAACHRQQRKRKSSLRQAAISAQERPRARASLLLVPRARRVPGPGFNPFEG